jgi:hypothetical protein
MAVAAPARRSQSQAAPAPPARTAPPEPKKRPRDRPRPGGPARSAAPATAPNRKPAAPKRKPAAPKRKAQTAAPARKTAPKRRAPARVIPIAAGTAGRAAVAVTQLPESGLIHRLTRGRAWIGVLGVLLAGIVAINVITLGLSAAAGHVETNITALEEENSLLSGRDARLYGSARVRHEAAGLGLVAASSDGTSYLQASKQDVAIAAQRLSAAASGY